MLVADIEHGERLIDADHPAPIQTLRHRPRHSTGSRSHVEDSFGPLQNEHFSQFLGEIGADLRPAAIKFHGVLRIMEMSFVPVAMPMFMSVFMVVAVPMLMAVALFVNMIVPVRMIRFEVLSMAVFVFVLSTHGVTHYPSKSFYETGGIDGI
jgi:hypothetical protein